MRTNIEINEELLGEAQKISGIADKSILIEKVLRLYIAVESQKRFTELWGKVEFDEQAIK